MPTNVNYAATYLSGRPDLILDALENNLAGFNSRLISLGEPPVNTVEEAYNSMESLGSEMTMEEFCELFDFEYMDNGQNVGLTNAFYQQAQLGVPMPGNLSTFSWSQTWKPGFVNFYIRNFYEDQESIVIDTVLPQPSKKEEDTKKTVKKTKEYVQKMSGLNLFLIVVFLGFTLFTVFKFSKPS
jgi:hypothetical protein